MKVLGWSLLGTLAAQLHELKLASASSAGIEVAYTVQGLDQNTFAATLDFRLAKRIESGWQFAFEFNSSRTAITQVSPAWTVQEGRAGRLLIPPPSGSLRCRLELQSADSGYGLAKFAIQLLPRRARGPVAEDAYAYQLDADGTTLVEFPVGLAIYLVIFVVGATSYAVGIRTRIRQRNHFRYLQQQRMHITGYLTI